MKIYEGDRFNKKKTTTLKGASAKCYNLKPKILQIFQPDINNDRSLIY